MSACRVEALHFRIDRSRSRVIRGGFVVDYSVRCNCGWRASKYSLVEKDAFAAYDGHIVRASRSETAVAAPLEPGDE